jgi:MoaA/NifB/PqqE/SkfB family radical SAM enzyme
MSDARLLRLVDEGAQIGLQEVAFVGGGEPLCRGVMPKLIRRIKGYGMEGDLVTNGTLFTDELIEEMVELGWDRVKFSLDGVDAETHDYLRGVKGTFDRVIDAIRSFARVKRRLGVDKPRLLLNTVISTQNYQQLPDLVRLGQANGLDGIWLLPLTVFDESARKLKLTHEQTLEFRSILRRAMRLTRRFGMEDNFEHFLKPKYMEKTEDMDEVMMEEVPRRKRGLLSRIIEREYPKSADPLENFIYLPCYIPWHHATIIPNGNIAPCFSPWVWNTTVSVKRHSFGKLWYGRYFDKFRQIMLTRQLPANCKRCCVWEVFNNRKIREGIARFIKGG